MSATIFLERRFLVRDSAPVDEIVSDCLYIFRRKKLGAGGVGKFEFLARPDYVESVLDRKQVRMNVYDRVAGAVCVYEQLAKTKKRSLRFARQGCVSGNWDVF